MSPPLKRPFWADIRRTLFGGMDRTGKLLGLLPFAISFLTSNRTLDGFLVALIFGSIIWIPYWIAWLASGGFVPTTDEQASTPWARVWRTAFGKMTRTRKLLWLLPYVVMLGLAPSSVDGVLRAIVGGTVLFSPYLLAWFLSDGFSTTRIGYVEVSPFASGSRDMSQDGYGSGGQGAGLYVDGTRIG